MIDQRCIGPGVDRSKISPRAEVSGASWLTGPRTEVVAGAVVRDSRLHDAVVETAAIVNDSIVVAREKVRTHKCDAAGRFVAGGECPPRIGPGAHVTGCTLTNTSVGRGSHLADSWAADCRIGPSCFVISAKLDLAVTGEQVRVIGPTEVSEAHLGHHATIDRRGYFEGVFSNAFRLLEFDASTGRLKVVGAIDLPHVSRCGVNTINSTNSGKLFPQPASGMEGFGPHVGHWHDPLLSHEQIELSPCCWVAPWTKIVGQSPDAHATDEELVNDELMTYVMPFAAAGLGGEASRGLVMPGELSVGLGPKERVGAWTFTYAPEMVFAMVRRLHQTLPDDRRGVADTIVIEAIKTALAMTRALAARHGVDLSLSPDAQRRGWPKWIARTFALLEAHLAGGLWRFEAGLPLGWTADGGKWAHPGLAAVLALAPDALDRQVSEEQFFAFDDPVPHPAVAVPTGAVAGTGGPPVIEPGAQVAEGATIGPGCRIDPLCVIGAGAEVWNSVLAGATVGPGAVVQRSVLLDTRVGAAAVVRSCRLKDAGLGERTTADAAAAEGALLAPDSVVSAFADLTDVACEFATILGGRVDHATIPTYLMSMHMAGGCSHLRAAPTMVELAGRSVAVPACPMLGGGSLVRGAAGRPVELEACFIGSNAIIEPNTFVGYGCFILGALGPDEGLLPFTVSTGGGAERHQIGAALGSLAGMIMSHFIGWTFQNVGPAGAEAVAEMTRQSIRRGIEAVEFEQARRAGGGAGAAAGERFARYRSLPRYSDAQLAAGLAIYRRAEDSGAWDLLVRGGQIYFANEKGRWIEHNGVATWRAAR